MMNYSTSFTITAESLLPAPESRSGRLWRRLRRKPAPTIQPAGTNPLYIDMVDGDVAWRVYFPAARIDDGAGA